jgi:hypothetical protein
MLSLTDRGRHRHEAVYLRRAARRDQHVRHDGADNVAERGQAVQMLLDGERAQAVQHRLRVGGVGLVVQRQQQQRAQCRLELCPMSAPGQ